MSEIKLSKLKPSCILFLSLSFSMATSIQRSLIGANTEDSIAVEAMPIQPLLSQLHRVSEALEVIGAPLSAEQQGELNRIKNLNPNEKDLIISSVEAIFDPLCIAEVKIPESGAPQISAGSAPPNLLEQGWRTFLVKVINPHGNTGRLFVESPNARPLPHSPPEDVGSRWMQLS